MRKLIIPFLACTLLNPSAVCADTLPSTLTANELRIPDLGNPANRVLSLTQEKDFAPQLLRELRREGTIIEDPELSDWIQSFGQRLVRYAPSQYGQFYFALSRDSAVNAYALPGGVIVINSALVLYSQSESELAGIMAHEIGHVTQRHIARLLAEQRGTPWLTALGILAGIALANSSPDAASAVATGTMAATTQRQLSYGRAAETEADRISLRITNAAGFGSHAMGDFLERLEQGRSSLYDDVGKYLSSHPLGLERLSDLHNDIFRAKRPLPADSIDYQYARAKLAQLNNANLASNTPPVQHYQQALKLQQWGRSADALGQLGTASQPLAVALLRAEALTNQGKAAAAIALLTPLRPANPKHTALAIALAEAYAAAGNLPQAWQTLAQFPVNESTSLVFFETKQKIAQQAKLPTEALLATAERNIRVGAYDAARLSLLQLQKQAPAMQGIAKKRLADIAQYEVIKKQLEKF